MTAAWPPVYDPAYRPADTAEVPEGEIPRTEFKARRVIDDRDLYWRSTKV